MNKMKKESFKALVLMVLMPVSFCIVTDQLFTDEWTSTAFEDCTGYCLKNRHHCKQVSFIGNNTCQFINRKYI